MKNDDYSQHLQQLSIAQRVEEDYDQLFELEMNDPNARYSTYWDEDTIYGDDPSYQTVADWITE